MKFFLITAIVFLFGINIVRQIFEIAAIDVPFVAYQTTGIFLFIVTNIYNILRKRLWSPKIWLFVAVAFLAFLYFVYGLLSVSPFHVGGAGSIFVVLFFATYLFRPAKVEGGASS